MRPSVFILAALLLAAGDAAAEPENLLPRGSLQVLQSAALQEAPQDFQLQSVRKPKSMRKAVLLSALLPGLGEAYSGHNARALVFFTLEGGIWISYATFKTQESLRQDRATAFAAATAGALPNGDDAYYSAMAQFLRSDGPGQWNEFVRRRERDFGEVVGVEYHGEAGWAWPSEDHFFDYRELRRRQLEASDNATNMLAVLIVNRIASMLDVVQAMRSDTKQREKGEQFGLKLQLGRTPGEPLARLMLQNRF
jgi:hypothetical protein